MPASLVALCFGNFVIGCGTIIVPGMLPFLAEGLRVTLPVAGQLVSAFAFTVCLGAPVLAALTSRLDRRALLVSMQLLYVAGHLLAALASEFLPMLLVRVFTSIGAALFTAQAAATAALLVPPQQRGRAIAFVFLGWSVAAVVSVPLGAYVAALFGWRTGFLMVAALSLVGAAAVWFSVPSGLRVPPVDAKMWRELLANRPLLVVIAVTALSAAPQFVIMPFIVPATTAFLQPTPLQLSLLLAGLGVMGVIGNALAARFVDRVGAPNVVMAAMLSMLAGHMLWPWGAGSVGIFMASMVLWGLGSFSCMSAQQARLATLAPQQASVSVALNSSALYLGQAAGPVIGGVLLASVPGVEGYQSLAAVSVPMFVVAVAVSAYAAMRLRRSRAG